MGNTPSKTPGQSGQPPGTPSSQGHDARVNRRRSIQALSGGKASAADPSPSKESATGHSAAQRQHTPLQQRLQSSRVPEGMATPSVDRPERRESRRGHENDSRAVPGFHSNSSTPEPSRVVQVPSTSERSTPPRRVHNTYDPPLNPHYPPHLGRPPRLPLPIDDATTTPGSPITASGSAGAGAAIDRPDSEGHTGVLESSDPTVDDDGMADDQDPYSTSGVNQAIPTPMEWHGGGKKVYVTGTFVNWMKKIKLKRDEDRDGVFSTTLQLRPGTHHLKFIVDGVMTTAEHLPTAVDFTNHLVNYVEVSADDTERLRRESDRQPKITIPPDIYPPKVIPESIHLEVARQAEEEEAGRQEPEEEIPPGDFRDIIPNFLVDIDKEEDTPAYQQAANIIGDYSTPPMLPLFLGRSILNGTTPMKDDSSVLNYPNHTVLNHLATSSIKNGVLATSATTRYKRKYVTTILYKPTE